ncbi:MAG TPA: pyridoxamine 5'-phosphate oxidase [Acidocella sp.]|jgi:pyridoxamine 5'-phosphate oxidase|uniref:pyridoxamine 5'-phosphate oxidase n=1 Tax=Acidocella sp. TaxID=50710 RepID=UPI002CF38DE0|nr:pyridoxamine 5'-phosphate oxidase [Acidocella sp.]HVE23173.1 pyridoxamine 5'-phosphate oxidase [Acidocella sp.]
MMEACKLADDPFEIFAEWLAAAVAAEPSDPNAMTLATADASGRPAARTVLLKAWDRDGFVFYGNLGSRKGRNLADNGQAALLFYWKSLYRQIRIEGAVSPVSDAQADAYFASRPRGSQLGAWASDQSRELASRDLFEARVAEAERRFPGAEIPRPEFWSGWRVTPDYFEFWQGQEFRLHDRLTFTRTATGWAAGRLYP